MQAAYNHHPQPASLAADYESEEDEHMHVDSDGATPVRHPNGARHDSMENDADADADADFDGEADVEDTHYSNGHHATQRSAASAPASSHDLSVSLFTVGVPAYRRTHIRHRTKIRCV